MVNGESGMTYGERVVAIGLGGRVKHTPMSRARTATHIPAALLALALALVAFFVVSGTARANVTPSLSASYPSSTNAEAHSNFRELINLSYNPAGDGNGRSGDDLRRLVLDYPAGLVGNPNAIPAASRCDAGIDYNGAAAGLGVPGDVTAGSGSPDYSGCPASSKVGEIHVNVDADVQVLLWVECNLTLDGGIYLLKNRPGANPEVPTYLGINVTGSAGGICAIGGEASVNLTAKIVLRDDDSGLRVSVIDDLPTTSPTNLGTAQIKINWIDQTVYGMADQGTPSTADDKPFLTNPTRCDAWVSKVYASAWDSNTNLDADILPPVGNDHKVGSSTLASPGCGALAAFNPGFTLTSGNTQAGAPTALTATLTNTVPTTNVAQPAYVKRVDLPLPPGYTINPAIANKVGASGCTDVQFNEADADTVPTCPAATEIGTVAIATPLITGAVAGKVYLGSPGPSGTGTDRYRLFVHAANGAAVKFQGRATVAPNGDVNVVFGDPSYDKSLPQVPYTSFVLNFDTGSAARQLIVNPQVCGSYDSTATLTPWTYPTQAAVTRTSALSVTAGTNGNCNFDAFNPTFTANISDTGAGKHPNVSLTVARNDRQDNLKDMTFSLPTGMAGSLTATQTMCPAATAAAGTCPSTSQVGTVVVQVGGAEAVTLNGTVHINQTADAGDVGKLSIQVPAVVGPFDLGKVVIYARLHLRSNMGIDSITANMPQSIEGIPVHYRSVGLTLNGIIDGGVAGTADDRPFLQNPSSCGTLNFDASITSAGEAPAVGPTTAARSDTDQFTTGCPTPFDPTLDVTPSSTETAKPTGLTIAVDVPQVTTGVTAATIQRSTVKRVQITMPVGVEINPAFTNGLTECSTANIDAGGDLCAPSSQIGTSSLTTPLLSGVQTGKVFLEQQGGTPATRYKLAVVVDLAGANGQPLVIRVAAQVNGSGDGVGAGDGQITADLDNLPDLPFSNFTMTFNPGPNAMFTNPQTCAGQSFAAAITPATTGGTVANVNDSYTTSYNGSGGACPGTDPWNPTFTQSVSETGAGKHPDVTLTVDRPDKDQQLRDFTIGLADGLAPAPAAAPECPQDSASAGVCAASTRVGTIAVQVGSGADTLALNGVLHNTVPLSGNVSRLTAIVPVIAGPFNLGTLSIPTNVTLRAATLGIDAATTNLTERFEGIPVRYRRLQMVLNGMADQGTVPTGDDVPYLTNPSKCQVNTTNMGLTSTLGNTVNRSDTYTTTGCPIIFSPAISTALSSSETAKPTGLTFAVNVPLENSTVKRVQLTMPVGFAINPAFGNGLTACTTATIDAGGSGCAASSHIGSVTLTTQLLAASQPGDVYLETPGGTPSTRYKIAIVVHLPSRDLIMHGEVQVNGSGGGADSGTGQVTADFDNLPDMPFTNLTAVFDSGDDAMLTNPETCGTKTFSAAITPHTTGGAVVNPNSARFISYDGLGGACPSSDPFDPAFAMTVSDGAAGAHPDVTMTFTRPDKHQQLRDIDVHFPAGFAASSAAGDQCAQADTLTGSCAAGTQVGTVAVAVGSGPQTYDFTGIVHNTVPGAGEVGRLTVVIHVVVGPYDLGYLAVPISATLRSDYGIDASATLPQIYEGVPVRLRSMALNLPGTGPSGPLFTNSSKCQLNTTNVDMTSSSSTVDTGSFGYTTTGCPLAFNPAFGVTPSSLEFGQPNGLAMVFTVPSGNSTVKRIQLTFPVGMEINPAVGNGLTTCSAANIDAGGGSCPAGSVMGTVSMNTPLLPGAQTGNVYLEDPGAGAANRYKLAIVINLSGQDIVVHGTAQVSGNGAGSDAGTGQVTADFDNIPDLPFTNLAVNLETGAEALLTNPAACGDHDFGATITPHTTGGIDAARTVTGTISYDGLGGACPGTDPFSPTLSGSVSTTAAGAHPNLTLTVDRLDKHQQLRKVKFSLPVGLAGSATAAPTCSQASADAGTCITTAPNSQVGSVAVKVGSGTETLDIATGKIFNTVAPANRPAKLTAVIPVVVGPYDLGKIITPIDVSLRSDLGIDAETGTLPIRWEGIPVRIRQLQTVLNGTAANGSFLTNPSKCQSNTTNATMTAPSNETATSTFSYTTTGCPTTFNPSITAITSSNEYGQPNGLALVIDVPSEGSTVKTINFLFPAGMEINPAAGNGLATCATATVDAGGNACPAGSTIGAILLTTPLLSGVKTGKLYLENPGSTPSDRYKLGVVVRLPGQNIVIHGTALVNGDGSGIDFGTGRVSASFDNIPDLPWTNLTVVMNTGDRALMTNPTGCGPQTVSADLTPNTTGGGTVTRTDSYTTDYDGLGGACPGSDPFSPTFDVSVTDTDASAHPDVTLTVTRGDKQKKLRKVKFSLPVGFTGSAAAAPTCAQVDADAGNCVANSEIGQVVTEVGSGAETYQLTGTVYNTVPPSGKPAKMTAIIPVVVGPYDLGKLIVPINISLRSGFGIDAETGNLPLRYEGIPVRIRSLATTLGGTAANGPFITNPSKCQTNTFDATLTPEAGGVVNASDGFTTTGCPATFDPGITADTDTTEYGQPSGLEIGVNVPENNSTVKRLQLAFPVGVELNPAVGNGVGTCSTADVDAGGGACPVASEMGTVTLNTPLLTDPQIGKLYLESPGGTPSTRYKLGIVIHIPDEDFIAHGSVQISGNGAGADVGNGQITADFNDLPDISFSSFIVAMRTGDRALVTNPAGCGNHTVTADITPNTTGGAAVTRTAMFDTSYDGASASCPASDPLTPTLDVQLLANALTPEPQQNDAGEHPDLRITVTRPDKNASIDKFKVRLPNGFTGSATAAPTCTQVDADAGNCTDDTKIGALQINVGSGPETFQATGKIFNTVAPANRPAKLTAVVPVVVGPYDLGKIVTSIDTTIANNTYQLMAEADLPLRHEGIPVRIRQMQIDLVGWADQNTPSTADDKPFMTNPHSCGVHDVFADVTSPQPQTVTASDTITIDAGSCPTQFNPDPTLTIDNLDTVAGDPTAIHTEINMGGGTNDATAKTVSMPFPAGFKLNAGGAQGVAACSVAQLDADSCAANTDIGGATLVTTLLANPLTGDVYLETPGATAADRYKLAVRLRGAVDITIHGVAQVNESTGDITAIFDDLPDIPFTTFTLDLDGYDSGTGAVPLIVNPTDTCGSLGVTATLTPYGGGNVTAPSDTMAVNNCPGSHGFSPTFGVDLSTTQAGANPTAEFNITRPEDDQDLRDVTVALPPGFMGSAAAVPLCAVATAQAGNCAAASKIGTVLVYVGYGPDLLTVNGEVFMTEGQVNGDIAGLAIRLPAVAGPYDLGVVNVLGRVILRSDTDFGLTTEFKDIPKAFKGVPVPVRDMSLVINGTVGGKKVLYNSSACSAMAFDGTMTSYDANNAADGSAYTATGCPSRAFQPTMHVQATGGTTKVSPTWDLNLKLPDGHSTLKNMTAVLPPVMTFNPTIPIQNQCHQAQIDAQACPATSKYGTVTVSTPLLPYVVNGDIFIGDPAPGVQLIRIIIKIGSPINMQLVGINDLVGGSITSTFTNVPDLIWTEMNMHFPGGGQGLIRANSKGACAGSAPGTAASHSGQNAGVTTTLAGTPAGTCGTLAPEPPECATPKVTMSSKVMRKAGGKKGQFKLSFGFSSEECYTLSAFQVRIKGSKVNKKKMKKSARGVTDVGRLTGKDVQTRGKDGVRVLNLQKKSARSITLTFKKGAWAFPGKLLCVGKKGKALKKCGKKKIAVRFVFAKNGVPQAYTYYISPTFKKLK